MKSPARTSGQAASGRSQCPGHTGRLAGRPRRFLPLLRGKASRSSRYPSRSRRRDSACMSPRSVVALLSSRISRRSRPARVGVTHLQSFARLVDPCVVHLGQGPALSNSRPRLAGAGAMLAAVAVEQLDQGKPPWPWLPGQGAQGVDRLRAKPPAAAVLASRLA